MACPVPSRSERSAFGRQSVSEIGFTGETVGQTIASRGLLPRAFGPRNFMKNRCLRWGTL
jgi:hypothetical protein